MPLDVPAFGEPLSLSGVVLSSAGTASHATLGGDESLRDALGSEPTAIRRFETGDLLSAFAEIHVSAPSTSDIEVTGALISATGEQVKRELGVFSGESGSGRRQVVIELSLSDVPTGRYTLRIEATALGIKVQRHIPIHVEEWRVGSSLGSTHAGALNWRRSL